jgi:hypothetical protein
VSNLDTRARKAFQHLVVVVDQKRRVSLGRGAKVTLHAEVQRRVIALVPPAAARGQDRGLFESPKSEQPNVELIAATFLARWDRELHVVELPGHAKTSSNFGYSENLVVFNGPWDH